MDWTLDWTELDTGLDWRLDAGCWTGDWTLDSFFLKLFTYMEGPYGDLWYAAARRADSGSGQLIVPPHRVLFT